MFYAQNTGECVRIAPTWTLSAFSAMAKTTWFYYDSDGKKQGPYSGGQLKWLAKNGKITPGTMLKNDDGQTAPAGKVQGLTFTASTPPEVMPVPTVAPPASMPPSPFTATSSGVFLNTTSSQNISPTPSIVEETKKANLLKNPIACAVIGFVGGLIVMFVFGFIYTSRDSYKKAVTAKYFEAHAVKALEGIVEAARTIAEPLPGTKRTATPQSVAEPKVIDPRLEQVKIDNFKLHKYQAQFSQPEINFDFEVANGTSKAIKTFAFDVVVKEPGRAIPLKTGGIRHSPPGGVEPNETRSFTDLSQRFGDWDMLMSKDLATLEVTTTVTSITFHDDEEIER